MKLRRRWLLVPIGVVVAVILWPRPEPADPDPVKHVEIPCDTQLPKLEGLELRRAELLASLAGAPAQGFPAALPWFAIKQIGAEKLYSLENLLANDPLLFLEMGLRRYKQEVQGYSLLFQKRERVAGKLQPIEECEVHYRDYPFSVHMHWLIKGASRAQKVLYVEGENKNQMVCRPVGRFEGLITVFRPPNGPDAKSSGRYFITQFGFYLSTQRTLASMRDAQARGTLSIKYHGMVRLAEIGDRLCYKFIRTPYQPVEEEGVNELVLYIDAENWLQVGSILRDAKGELIGEYFFRDIQFNPTFSENQFTRNAV